MIFKTDLGHFLKALRTLKSAANKGLKSKSTYHLSSISSHGADTIVLWCGEIQAVVEAEVLNGGGVVFDLKRLIQLSKSFKGQSLEVWQQGDEDITFKVGERSFAIKNIPASMSDFQAEQVAMLSGPKPKDQQIFERFLKQLMPGRAIAYIDERGRVQYGAFFLGFVQNHNTRLAGILNGDHEMAFIPSEKIGRSFHAKPESDFPEQIEQMDKIQKAIFDSVAIKGPFYNIFSITPCVPESFNIYGSAKWADQSVWCISCSTHPSTVNVLCSCRAIIIDKATGEILYDGDAGDEG